MTRTLPEARATEDRPQQAPVIAVPTITIDGQRHPFTPPGPAGRPQTGRRKTPSDQRIARAHTQAVIDADHL
jgi:hypothetical protein